MKKNGFTLIELLAIIVILAIIAVITVPIILGIIDDASTKTAIDSAYGFNDSVSKGYLVALFSDDTKPTPTGTFVMMSNGNMTDSESNVLVTNVSGNYPEEDSWVELDKGQVVAFSLKFGDYVVTKYRDTDVLATKNGEIAENTQAREARLEAGRQASAIVAARAIVDEENGTTEIVEITEGWVAFINGEVKAYSLKVSEGDYTYVVTDLDVDINNSHAIADRTISDVADTTQAEQLIVSYKVDSYVKAALAANSSLTDETAKSVSDMSGVTTNQPNSGWIHFNVESNTVSVVDYSLTYGTLTANYASLTGGNYVSTFGASRNKPAIISMTKGIKVGNIQYYTGQSGATADDSDNIVYFDPTSNTGVCTETDYTNNADKLGKTGCMRWYVYSIDEDNNVVNMILDHNTTGGIAWSGYNNQSGPNQAFMTQLATDTNGWTSNKIISPYQNSTQNQYKYTATWTYNSTQYSYTIDYTGYKARLIEADEVAKIKGNNSWTYTTSTSTITSNIYAFLKANLSDSSVPYGYWTSSPSAGNSSYAWYVRHDGFLNSFYVSYTGSGVRPVISVLKSSVF